MPRITVELSPHDPGSVVDAVDKQIRFANVLALTRVAKRAQEDIREDVKAVFDRPTPWTLNSTRVRPATKKKPYSEVLLKDEAFKGRPADEQLHHQVHGAERLPKRSERHLRRIGLFGPNEFVVPGEGARRDRYGNISRGQIQQILSAMDSPEVKTIILYTDGPGGQAAGIHEFANQVFDAGFGYFRELDHGWPSWFLRRFPRHWPHA